MVARSLINWSDEQFEKACDDVDEGKVVKGCARAALSGAAEGLVEGCVLGMLTTWGIILMAKVIEKTTKK